MVTQITDNSTVCSTACSVICAWTNGWVNRDAGDLRPSRSLWRHCNCRKRFRVMMSCIISARARRAAGNAPRKTALFPSVPVKTWCSKKISRSVVPRVTPWAERAQEMTSKWPDVSVVMARSRTTTWVLSKLWCPISNVVQHPIYRLYT